MLFAEIRTATNDNSFSDLEPRTNNSAKKFILRFLVYVLSQFLSHQIGRYYFIRMLQERGSVHDDEEAESMTVRVTCTCTRAHVQSCIPATVTE